METKSWDKAERRRLSLPFIERVVPVLFRSQRLCLFLPKGGGARCLLLLRWAAEAELTVTQMKEFFAETNEQLKATQRQFGETADGQGPGRSFWHVPDHNFGTFWIRTWN